MLDIFTSVEVVLRENVDADGGRGLLGRRKRTRMKAASTRPARASTPPTSPPIRAAVSGDAPFTGLEGGERSASVLPPDNRQHSMLAEPGQRPAIATPP